MKKKQIFNLKTVLASIGVFILVAGWAVTGAFTQENRKDVKEVQGEMVDLKLLVYQQSIANQYQQKYNDDLNKLLEEEKKGWF